MDTRAIPSVSKSSSHLFTVRIWYEHHGPDPPQFRIQVKHVLTGETRYFLDWALVRAFLIAKVKERSEPP